MSDIFNYWQEAMRRRVRRRTLLRTGAIAGVSLVAGNSLVGCGGQSKSEPKAGTTPSAGDKPQSGGLLTYWIGGDPPNFDLISQSTYMMQHPMAPIYNNLVVFDPHEPDKIVGDLAEKWDISPDGKTYTFYLKKGVNFHDGKPCTAADVKATFDIVRDPPKGYVSPRKGAFAAVDGIEIVDPSAVRFVLKRPSASLMINLAQGWMAVMPKHILDAKGNMEKDAVGTGPFMLKEYNRGNYVHLVKNPNYHVKGLPYLDEIKMFIIPDPSTTFANLRSGNLLFYYAIKGEDARQAEKEFGDKVEVQSIPSTTGDCIFFNGKKKPWDDARVRLAMSYATDREDCIKVTRQGDGFVSANVPPGSYWALPQAELDKLPGYGKDKAANIAQAKKLLAEAGYPNGFATTMLTRKGSSYEPLSVFLKDQLAKVGIDAKLDVQETAAATESLNNRSYDLAPWVATVGVADPDAVFGDFELCNSGRNYSGFCSKEVDDLYEKQSQEMNQETRQKLVWQLDKAATANLTRVLLDYNTRFIAYNRKVKNYKLHNSIFSNQRLVDVWLAKS